MRNLLCIILFCACLQPVLAQTNPIITVDNAHRIEPLMTIDFQSDDAVADAIFSEFSPSDLAVILETYLVTEDTSQTSLHTWDLATQQISNMITFDSWGLIFKIWQIPDQSRLVTVSIGGTIFVQDYPSGTIQHTFQSSSSYYVTSAVSADGHTLVYTNCDFLGAYLGGCDPSSWSLGVYDLDTFSLKNTIDIPDFEVHELALSSDGQYVLVQSTKGDLIIWDLFTFERIAFSDGSCEIKSGGRNALFIDKATVVVSEETGPGYQHEHQVRLWNFATDEERILFTSADSFIRHLAFTPDNIVLGVGVLTGEYREVAQVYLVAIETGQILTQLDTGGYPLDFSPDGRYLITGRDPGVIWGLAP